MQHVCFFIARIMMELKASLLGCTLPAAMAAAQGQLYFGAEDSFATRHHDVQTPLNRDFRLTCEALANTISPVSQVFFPGKFSSLCLPVFFFSKSFLVRHAGISGGYLPLGQFEYSSSNVLRASR